MATTDLLTIDEARNAIMAPDQRNDEWLAVMNSAVAQRIDARYGPVVQRTVPTEYHDGGSYTILPRYRPVASITSLVEYQGVTAVTLTAETPGSATTNAYVIRADGSIMRRNGGFTWTFWPNAQNIALTYVAGRYASTDAVTEVWKQAAMITLADIWRDVNGSGNTTFGADGSVQSMNPWDIPRKAQLLLQSELRIPGIA